MSGAILGVALAPFTAGMSLWAQAAIAGAVSVAGAYIDSQIFGQTVKGPRLDPVSVTSSTEGQPITRLYGTARLGGAMIWATRFKETKKTQKTGGKGGPKSETYSYTVSFAVAFCEGSDRTTLGRVWADGKIIDLSKFTYRFYNGSETQTPDSLIESIEGSANVPAFRGTAYLVFESMDLTSFGNRIPQITAELTRPVQTNDSTSTLIEGVTLIPATGSFAYSDEAYIRQINPVESGNENAHATSGQTDLLESLDQLDASLPNCDTVAVVVAWFGDDLRCGVCEIKPRIGIPDTDRATVSWIPNQWEVDGLNAADVDSTSTFDGSNAYGSTPDDASVIACIQELNTRGKRVVFYPFILMDIPSGNALPDPYLESEQAAYPWRGRITCHPAPGETGTVDKTATAGTQVDTFFTSTWGYNNFITHYANLCATAGGVDAFLIGSELVGLTKVRAASNTFTAVNRLKTLAATVSAILPGVSIGYAADWSEYHSYRPSDGTNDVYFNLDPLWSDANIDFVGIDNYLPITDHRQTSTESIYDIGYLKTGIESGEYYDWYYASDAARTAGTRTAITDGAYSKPWVFRNKDIRNWWRNVHYNRPGGTEAGSPTSWTSGMKPIWFTEFGCGAVNRGSNQPNVFQDNKSSESATPYFSTGARDDLMQSRYLRAMVEYWTDNGQVASTEETEVSFTALKTALGASDGDTVGMSYLYAEKSAHAFNESDFPQGYSVQLLNNAGVGQVIISISRSTSGSAPSGETAAIDATGPGDFYQVRFDDIPGTTYEFNIRSVLNRFQATYYDTHVTVLVLSADLVGTAGSGSIGTMIDPSNMIAWTWDARPYPAFPLYQSVWGDAENYSTGHWLNGRIGSSSSLANLIIEICGRTMDTTLIDTSLVVGEGLNVTGYQISQVSSPRDDLSTILSLFSINAYESEGKIKFVQKSMATTITIDTDDLVPTSEMPIGYKLTDAQAYELPGEYMLTYISQNDDYQNASVSGIIEGGDSVVVASASYPMVLTDDVAKSIAETLVHDAWISKETVSFSLPPSYAKIEPGDVVRLGSKNLGFRVNRINNAGAISLEGNGCEPTIYSLDAGSLTGSGREASASSYGKALVVFLDIPLITGLESDPQAPRLAANAIPWPGSVAVFKANGAGGYDLNATIPRQSVIGELTSALASGTTSGFDTANDIEILLYTDDDLSSSVDADVSAGANLLAILSPTGLWEMVGFVNATLTGTREYTLDRLLRGRYGTENEMLSAPYPIGSLVVLIDEDALGVLNMAADQRNVALDYRYGPSPYPQDNIAYQDITFTAQCVGLRPYAPSTLTASKDVSNNWNIGWTRRTRQPAGSTTPPPLNEEAEVYEVEIMDAAGTTVKRTVTGLGAPAWQYSEADQIIDFGSSIASIKYRVYQISATIGRGSRATYP